MTQTTQSASRPDSVTPPTTMWPMPLVRRGTVSAIITLFSISIDRLCRTRRLVVVVLLFALPVTFAILARNFKDDYEPRAIEESLIFMFIPNALVPLTSLLYTSGMIQDEIEEQTLTYLMVRPLPRWSIYVTKLLAAILVTGVLVGIFTLATYVAVFWGSEGFWSEILASRAWKTIALLDLALLAYCTIFGCLSLFVRRSLVVGVGYIVIFEGVLANIRFVVRQATVMFYFRVLCERWLDFEQEDWSIDLSTAPDSRTCVSTLLVASLVATVLAAVYFSVREFRLKTPEGS
jgi:ABC-2 type transport system permease protein